MTVGDEDIGTLLRRECLGCGKMVKISVADSRNPLESIDEVAWGEVMIAHMKGEYHQAHRVDYDRQSER